MTLAEYLASELAREDVKALLAQPSQTLGELAPDTEARVGSVRTEPLPVTWSDYKHAGSAWRQVELDHADGCLSVYYRPDGDRYVVTDLGDGVRAYRLATGRTWWQAQENDMKRNAISHLGGESGHSVCPAGGAMELAGVTASDLPDAICRVMLASLRVAQS